MVSEKLNIQDMSSGGMISDDDDDDYSKHALW